MRAWTWPWRTRRGYCGITRYWRTGSGVRWPRGDVAWLCAPSWDSGAVFSSLLGGGGCYAVTPANPRFVSGGYYEEGSLIWRSR